MNTYLVWLEMTICDPETGEVSKERSLMWVDATDKQRAAAAVSRFVPDTLFGVPLHTKILRVLAQGDWGAGYFRKIVDES